MVLPFEIRRLRVADVEDYRTIRLAALRTEPEAFGSVYDIEVTRPVDSFVERLASSIVLGAYAGERIVGVAGFRQESGPSLLALRKRNRMITAGWARGDRRHSPSTRRRSRTTWPDQSPNPRVEPL